MASATAKKSETPGQATAGATATKPRGRRRSRSETQGQGQGQAQDGATTATATEQGMTATTTTEPQAEAVVAAPATVTTASAPTVEIRLSGETNRMVRTAATRLAHAVDLPKLKTLAVLEAGSFESRQIAAAIGYGAEAIIAHMEGLRRAKLVNVDREGGGARYSLTDEGRKLWQAVRFVGEGGQATS